MRVLAGDVGGTKTSLAVYRWEAGELLCERQDSFASKNFDTFEGLLATFLATVEGGVEAAAFGVAGPVKSGTARLTNLTWEIDASSLSETLHIPLVVLINDLEATGYGVRALLRDELVVLNPGRPRPGPIAVISAGTGLGEGWLWWDGHEHYPAPSQGGHGDFAPRNDLEVELLQYLRAKFGHVSYERLLSGSGLLNIYSFLRDAGYGVESSEIAGRLEREDPAAVIAGAALSHRVPLCVQALDVFVSIYGAEAGNLALKLLPACGLYVAGGIASKISAKITDGAFLESYLAKGRMRPVLEEIPIYLVMAEDAPLRGAAVCAVRQLNRKSD